MRNIESCFHGPALKQGENNSIQIYFMKKLLLGFAATFAIYILVANNWFVFAPKFDSQNVAGFRFPEGSKLALKRRDLPYKVYKWLIPEDQFPSITVPDNVQKSPFDVMEWKEFQWSPYKEGPSKLLRAGEVADDSEAINYRTEFHAITLIRSPSESTITILSIYHN